MAELAERIRTLRDAAGLTQDELAARCGRRGKSTVSKWESGKASPPAALLPRLAEVLQVTVGELYGEPQADPQTATAAPSRVRAENGNDSAGPAGQESA